MLRELRQEVYKLISSQLMASPRVAGAAQIGRMQNRAYSTGSATAPTGVTNAMSLIIGAALLNVRGSGIFRAGVTLALTGITATDTTTLSVQTLTTAPATMTLATATKVGFGTGSASTTTGNGLYVSSAAAGIVVTGGAGSVTQFTTGSQVAGTAATTVDLAWTGMFGNSIAAPGAEVPFTAGNQILLTVTLLATHSATVVYSGFSLFLEELGY